MEKNNANTEFEIIYRTYYKKMFGLCMSYVHDKVVAEDLLQDSFIIVITKLSSLKDRTKLQSWITTIVKNTCINYLRKKSLFSDIAIDSVAEPIITDTEAEMQEKTAISYSALTDMVEKLPDGYKKVFKLAVFEGMSHEEIAQLLNISPKTSASQLHRAKKAMKSMIRSYWSLLGVPVLIVAVCVLKFVFNDTTRIAADLPKNNSQNTVAVTDMSPKTPQKTYTRQLLFKPVSEQMLYNDSSANDEINTIAYHNSDVFAESNPTDTSRIADVCDNRPFLPTQDKPVADNNILKSVADITDYVLQSPSLRNDWSLKANFSSFYADRQRNGDVVMLPENEVMQGIDVNITDYLTVKKLHAPVALSLSIEKRFDDKFSLDCGLVYTFLKSEYSFADTNTAVCRLQYAGIKSQVMWRCLSTKFFAMYMGIGGMFEVPVYSAMTFERDFKAQNITFKAHNQWSVSFSTGVNCNLSEKISLFVQPQINYMFDNGDCLPTYRTKHPLSLDFPMGIRIIL